jgi:hypothetical protein
MIEQMDWKQHMGAKSKNSNQQIYNTLDKKYFAITHFTY